MSEPPRLDGVALDDKANPYVSQNKWRHQESSKYAEYAGSPRDADSRTASNDLADFFNKSRIPAPPGSASGSHKPIVVGDEQNGNERNGTVRTQTSATQGTEPDAWHGRDTTLDVKCGPLLNYRRMENQTWYGSVLVVTDGGSGAADSPEIPELHLQIEGDAKEGAQDHTNLGLRPKEDVLGANGSNGINGSGPNTEQHGDINGHQHGDTNASHEANHNGEGNHTESEEHEHDQPYDKKEYEKKTEVFDSSAYEQNGVVEGTGSRGKDTIEGTKLYSDSRNTFWRFDLEVKMRKTEIKCSYSIPALKMRGKKSDKQSFFIPAIHDSMRIMFHSCNGFSVGTDEEAYSGAALWNDVYRVHAQKPFHVM